MSVTPSFSVNRRVRLFVWLFLIMLAQGLQTSLAETDEQLDSLAERAKIYWEARVADDPITMYELEESNVQGIVSLRDYVRKGGGIAYNSAVLKDVRRVDEDEALAILDVEFRIHAMGGDWLKREIASRWVLIDGEWYHQYRSLAPGRSGSDS